jgi:basic membrane protein A
MKEYRMTFTNRTRPILLILALLGALSLFTAACGDDDSGGSTTLTVGALHVGSVKDNGYNQAMHEGLVEMTKNVKGIKLIEAENVPESADAERVMENMIQQGAKLIFPMSFGYLDPALNVAKKHPEVKFAHPAGFKNADNLATFWSDTTAMTYLTGIAAAKESKSGKLGWVIGFPIPNILTSINAFTLGAQTVNPNISVQVIVDNAWVDPAKEAEAVNALADAGVDVVTMIVDSPATVVQTADKRGIKSIGFHCLCVKSVAGKGWITGIGFTWGPLFTKYAQDVINGTFKGENTIGTLDKGYAALADWGSNTTSDTKKLVEQAKADLIAKKVVLFKGPVVDNEGKVRIKEGETGDLGQLLGATDYLVKGATGKIK